MLLCQLGATRWEYSAGQGDHSVVAHHPPHTASMQGHTDTHADVFMHVPTRHDAVKDTVPFC